MVHFQHSRGAELLTRIGYIYKEKNILGCHQGFFLEVWCPFLASLSVFLTFKKYICLSFLN